MRIMETNTLARNTIVQKSLHRALKYYLDQDKVHHATLDMEGKCHEVTIEGF